MKRLMRVSRTLLCMSLLWGAIGVATAQTAPASQRVRGQVVQLEGNGLQLRAESGQLLTIQLTPDVRIGAVSRGDLSRIVSGAYIGVAGMPQPDGSVQAIDLRVFPESMRGTGEGHRPMDARTGATMTNATVSAEAARTITNATVSDVSNAEAERKITVKYTSGEKVVTVRPDTPVLIIETGDRAMLVPGARITANISTQAGGAMTADRVTVGLNGAIPPL